MAVLPGQTGANVRQIVTGTASPFTLGAAVANYLTLAAIGGVASDTFYGTCEEVDASGNRNGVWVYGLWTIGSGTVTLTTALRNSAGGTTAPTFGAGTKHLYISDSPDLDILTFAADGEVLYRSGTTLDGATKVLVDPSDGNLLLADNTAAGAPASSLKLISRVRHGTRDLEVIRPNGRDFPLQPLLGVNKVVMWIPENTTTIRTWGMPITNVGTVSTPTLASTNLSTSQRRWRLTSAATANAAAENRAAATLCWRGNAAGLGGFRFVSRFSLGVLTTNCRGFVGLTTGTGAIATTQVPSALTDCVGFGWDATETTLRFQHNDGSGTATRTDLGANFPVNVTTAVYDLFLFAPANSTKFFYRVARQDADFVAEGESLTTDIPAATSFMTIHQYMNNGGDASACAFECAGVYLERDF
jgi:hypothetical protein